MIEHRYRLSENREEEGGLKIGYGVMAYEEGPSPPAPALALL